MWDERYSEEGYAYGTEANDFLRAEYLRIAEGGRVLCLAEGEGRNAVFLARHGYSVTAVDQSAVGLQKAQALAAGRDVNISTVVADLAEFDFATEAWDGIVSIAAHVPPSLRKRIHAGVVRSLKKGGVFILEGYTTRHLEMKGVGGPRQKELLMSLDALQAELEGLELVVGREVERTFSEGKYHYGESAVVQVVARRGHASD